MPDGLLVLRKQDIAAARRSATDVFQQRILQEEGASWQVPFGQVFDAHDWASLIRQLACAWPLLVLECECRQPADFLIGKVLKIGRKQLQMRGFSGTARWLAIKRRACTHISCAK